MATRTRIGVLGGSFNPVHLGHLLMGQDALELFGLEKVIFMPCANPPHKPASALAPAADRLAMLRAAIRGDRRFQVSELEIRRGGTSYTVETMRLLVQSKRAAEWCFIIGGDSLPEIHAWRDIAGLMALCRIVTIARPGFRMDGIRWPEGAGDAATILKADVRAGHLADISSTDVRRRVAEGRSIRYLVPPAVERYIADKSLYRS